MVREGGDRLIKRDLLAFYRRHREGIGVSNMAPSPGTVHREYKASFSMNAGTGKHMRVEEHPSAVRSRCRLNAGDSLCCTGQTGHIQRRVLKATSTRCGTGVNDYLLISTWSLHRTTTRRRCCWSSRSSPSHCCSL